MIASIRHPTHSATLASIEEESWHNENQNILIQLCKLVSSCLARSSYDSQIDRSQLKDLERNHKDTVAESSSMMRQKAGTHMITSLLNMAAFAASLAMPPNTTSQQVAKFLSEQIPQAGSMINQLEDSSIAESSSQAQMLLAQYNNKSSNAQGQSAIRQTLEQLLRSVEEVMKKAASTT